MKKFIYLFCLTTFVFISCSDDNITDLDTANLSFFKDESTRISFENSLRNHYYSNKNKAQSNLKGSKFIEPFYTGEGFAVTWFRFPYIGYAVFETEYGKGDFYRENRDGTISVHVNSNKAFVTFREFSLIDPEDEYTLTGDKGHLNVDFTANHVFEDIYDWETGEYLFTWEYLDFENSSRAVSIHGNAKVYNEDTGESNNVSLTIRRTPSGKIDNHVTKN